MRLGAGAVTAILIQFVITGALGQPAAAPSSAPNPAPPAVALPAVAPPPVITGITPAQRPAGDCIGDNRFIYRPAAQLISATPFIPAGRTAEFVLKVPYEAGATYYAKFSAPWIGSVLGGKDIVNVTPLDEKSPYVAKGIASKTDSLIRVQVPAAAASYWRNVTLRVYSCESKSPSAPIINSMLSVRVSSNTWATTTVIISAILAYLGAAFALRSPDPAQRDPRKFRFLSPILLTAGSDGRGSLAKLQILFFSLIVAALLLYVLLRTGELSDLSQTILLLLGIAAIGSTAAKATDVKQSRFGFENWAWLVEKGWLPIGNAMNKNIARWSDLVTSDGEFDVYRYQSCIFSLVVGGALLFVGVYNLAVFDIPQTLLGLLGLSQIVYVTGKLVSPTAVTDADKAITALRVLEQDIRTASNKLALPVPDPNDSSIRDAVQNYRSSAKAASLLFASATNLMRPTNFDPTLS